MERISKKLGRTLPCLVCGVDSGPIRVFLFVVIGGVVLSSILVWVWAFSTGRLRNSDELSNLAIEAEQGESHVHKS